MSDDKKLTLGARPTLGAKKTVEAGKVRQSFSHGRTNSVVVEIKQRRPLLKPGAAPEAAPPVKAPQPEPVPEVARKPEPAVTRPGKPQQAGARTENRSLSSNEQSARQEAVQAALRRAEEDRLRLAEEARRRAEQDKIAQQEAEREAREARKRDEDARSTESAREAEAAPETPAPPAREVRPSRETPPPHFAVSGPEEAERDAGRAKVGPKTPKVEVAKPARPRGDERRQSGKLTVTRALESDDQMRVRSLAALRRAREKERRAHQSGVAAKQVRDVTIPETITVQELANRMAERGGDVIKSLFRMGVVATLTQSIDQDTAELIVSEFGHNVNRVAESDVEIGLSGEQDRTEELVARPPVVTIMGHVDHGKTSLLDALRNTDVAAGEAGGITQHIGAYQVTLKGGDKITFLDTPGHEAFTQMRARGANITDIAVLVVAADDGIMPQTIESINHAKAANVPLIVAINKCDKPDANPDRVRQMLLQHSVVVEKMSGDVQDVEVSALKKTGLEELTGALLAQAELLELKANPARMAEGTIIEAKLDKGRGPVATVLIKRGTLKVGDIFVAGPEWGKVRALLDDKGRQIKQAGPSMPVEILGISGAPGAGDDFSVVETEARAREVAAYRQTLIQRKRQAVAPTTLESMFSNLKANKAQDFPVIVKGDVQGSVEAIIGALDKLSTDEIRVRVIHSGVGGISESDVTLAQASSAPIIGFNVRANKEARTAAEATGISINYYSIIYNLVDEVKAAMAGKLGPQMVETVIGRATVRDVFTAGKAGKAAGCYVAEGTIRRNAKARLMRDDVIVYTGALSSLRRFKDDVNEVRTGLECGMTLENYQDIKAGDVIEAFEVEQRERVL